MNDLPATPPAAPAGVLEEGRTAAILAYSLYLLSIPSAALLAPAGVIIAYACRGRAQGLARTHLEDQIRIFWIAFVWGVVLSVASLVAWALTVILIGFPLLWLIGLAAFVVMVWFTIKSAFGLWRLLQFRPA